MGADVNEHQFSHPCGMGHAGRAGRAHRPVYSPFASITAWSSQRMHSIMSAPRASSVTESQGWVSPVNITLPSAESTRWAKESSHGWACSAARPEPPVAGSG